MSALALSALCACTSSFSLTFNVATGDTVEVELDTSDGLKLESGDGGNSFFVSRNGTGILDGSFIYDTGADDVRDLLVSSGFSLEREIQLDGASGDLYVCRPITGTEQNVFVLSIDGSSTGVVLEATDADADPVAVAQALSFSIEQ